MKRIKMFSTGVVAVACVFGAHCLAQPGGYPQLGAPSRPPTLLPSPGAGPVAAAPAEARFDLSFSGGTPAALIQAIEDASHQHINAVIPEEYANIQIPPLKMQAVTVSELFGALQLASRKTVKMVTGTYYGGIGLNEQYTQKLTSFGFYPAANNNNIWYFNADLVDTPQSVCRFYALSRELEKVKIEDITTAIQTGWDMLDLKSKPTLKFHPETKLLIAVGAASDLKVIEQVIEQLDKSLPKDERLRTAFSVKTKKNTNAIPEKAQAPAAKKGGEPADK